MIDGKTTKGPLAVKRRKRLLDSKVMDISYDDLHQMYMTDCRLRGIAEVTIKGYEFAYTYFKKHVDEELKCSDITQDIINGYVLHLKDRLKVQTVNSYQFKISPVIKFGMKKGYIKDTIEFTRLAEQEHIKEIYTHEELKRMLKRPESPTFAEYRNWVLVNFLLATPRC
jgi:integrase/recombinase XerD